MKPVQFSLDEDIPNICDDLVFKAVLTRDSPPSRKALNGLLSAILGRKVRVLTITANEPPPNSLTDRQIRYDINVKLENGELANIEMTKDPDSLEPLRAEYYLARLHCSQDIRGVGRNFSHLKNSWQISFLINKNLYRDKALVHRFAYYDKANSTLLGGRTAIITLELKKAKALELKPVREMSSLERWACFFRYSADKTKRSLINEILKAEKGITMAGKVIQRFSKKEQEFFDNISREKYQVDMSIKRQRERERVDAKARKEERMDMAQKLKVLGVPEEQIAAASGLSLRKIKSLLTAKAPTAKK